MEKTHIVYTVKADDERIVAMTPFKDGFIICTSKRVLQIYEKDKHRLEINAETIDP